MEEDYSSKNYMNSSQDKFIIDIVLPKVENLNKKN